MMKKIALLCAVLLCVSALVACGDKVDLSYDKYNLDEYLTLGDYIGVEVNKLEIQKMYDDEVTAILENNAEDVETEKPAEKGNIVTYSMTGTVDGAEVSSLKKTDATFTVGTSKTDYEKLTNLFTGVSKDEEHELTVTLPGDYTDATVAGKDAVLKVKISSVTTSVVPEELTDAMVKEATDEQYATVAEYSEYLYKAIKENLLWTTVMENITFKGYPKEKAEYYYNNYVASYQNQAAQYASLGISSLEDFLSMLYGVSLNEFCATMASNAVAQVEQDMAIIAIAKRENLVPDQARLDAVAEEIAAAYGYTSVEELMQHLDDETIEQSAVYEMVLEFITEKSVEIEKELETEADEDEKSEQTEEGTNTEGTETETEDTETETEGTETETAGTDTEAEETEAE